MSPYSGQPAPSHEQLGWLLLLTPRGLKAIIIVLLSVADSKYHNPIKGVT